MAFLLSPQPLLESQPSIASSRPRLALLAGGAVDHFSRGSADLPAVSIDPGPHARVEMAAVRASRFIIASDSR